jgi:hypothetical protein
VVDRDVEAVWLPLDQRHVRFGQQADAHDAVPVADGAEVEDGPAVLRSAPY